jgi:hypothetical protein
MSDSRQTLTSFFGTAGVAALQQGATAVSASPALAGLAQRLATQVEMFSWPGLLGDILAKAPDLLELDPSKILANAWARDAEFRKYADPELYPPDETVLVELVHHVIKSTQEPKLEIVAANKVLDTVDFKLAMAITIEGAILHIRDGKIWEVALGNCTASGSLSCEGLSLFERKSEPFKLPGKLEFSEPMSIVASAD